MYFPANLIVGGLRYFEHCWRQGGRKAPPPPYLSDFTVTCGFAGCTPPFIQYDGGFLLPDRVAVDMLRDM